jgi:hypothetical protein
MTRATDIPLDKVKLVSKGNAKLGPNVFHTNLPAGDSCPGKSEWCNGNGDDAAACYAQRGFYLLQTRKYRAQLDILRDDPLAFSAMLQMELAKLKSGSVFRFHTSGDIDSVEHVGIIRDAVLSRSDVTFYLYTRSWMLDDLREAIERELFPLDNLFVWASTDYTMPAAPDGWREATVVQNHDDARGPICPEQTGKRKSCSDCGLCWNAKPDARLTFLEH